MEKKTFLAEMMEDLEKSSRILQEAYIFNDEENDAMGDELSSDMNNEMYGEMPHEEHHPSDEGNSAEEQAMHAQEVIEHEPIVGKIREIAIDGLKKYADHPTSSLYLFMKKIFMEADKVLTDNGTKK